AEGSCRMRARGPPCAAHCARSGRDPAAARVLGYRRASSAQVALLDAAGHVVAEVRAIGRRRSLPAHQRLVALLLLVLGRGVLGGASGLTRIGLRAYDGPRLRVAGELERRRVLRFLSAGGGQRQQDGQSSHGGSACDHDPYSTPGAVLTTR